MAAPPRPDLQFIEVVVALHDYQSEDASIMSFKRGDFVYVHQKDASGWWEGTLGNAKGVGVNIGWFPHNFFGPAQVVSLLIQADVKKDESMTANLERVLDTTNQMDKLNINTNLSEKKEPEKVLGFNAVTGGLA